MIRENEGRTQKLKDRDLERRRTKNQREGETGGQVTIGTQRGGGQRPRETEKQPKTEKSRKGWLEVVPRSPLLVLLSPPSPLST